MLLNKKTIGDLTPETIRNLQPNDVIAVLLYTRTKEQLQGVQLMSNDAYNTAIKRVGRHFNKKTEGGLLKIDTYKNASENIKLLAESYRAAIEQRKLADKIIAAVPFLKEEKTGINLPKHLKVVKALLDPIKGGLNTIAYAEMKNFPNLTEALQTLRETPARKTASTRENSKQPEPSI